MTPRKSDISQYKRQTDTIEYGQDNLSVLQNNKEMTHLHARNKTSSLQEIKQFIQISAKLHNQMASKG